MKAWERQPDETVKAFEAFSIYRDLGVNRNIRDVAQKLDKSLTIIGRWSSANNWVERVQAYDDHLEQIERKQLEKKRLEQRERRLNISLAFQAKMVKALERMSVDDMKAIELANALRIVNAEIRKDLGDDIEQKRVELVGDEDKPVVVKTIKGVSFDDL